ncbi:rod shape-determining protein MreC [Delftia tsuruhatensis]|uniref:rod shape-determining protein MreC n=1 Tax=Delftia tsuruhatensis TaxID=180282 RepID=UPI001E73DA4C|nr:rod shape-determining protein MreC [Delftia tsuruhatensis]CAB5718767.1 rod shape-determining protein MreC [Delftia tsuruhatensis]CAC9676158.1 rod shape-determining protein MreC [Delftia tsuruhatensis]
MNPNTLDHSAPSLFKRRPSRVSQLAIYGALALFLMVADARFKITDPVRVAVATVLYPVQWVMLKPVEAVHDASRYLGSLDEAQAREQSARKELVAMAQRASLADELIQENDHLRELLQLRERLTTPGTAAEVIYDSPDVYTRRVVIDRGQVDGIAQGSPVLDEKGVVGQVTRVYPLRAEVTLLIDRDQAIPVFNPRTGARSVAYGDPSPLRTGGIELRFMPSNADVQEGDLLTTSGVDGLYPPGLPVAKVVSVERRADSAFSRIYCEPVGRVQGVRHVMVLKPLDRATHPEAEGAAEPIRAGKGKGKDGKGKEASKDGGKGGKGSAPATSAPKKEPA